jgi:sugar O-acyltransferase (sialic acid O-acetyltransferase NeuD family)
MGSKGIILIGGGGHAKVVFDTLCATGADIAGVFDDSPRCPLADVIEHLGPISSSSMNEPGILCVGDLRVRRVVLDQLCSQRFAAPAIHPSAIVSPSASIAEGVFVGPGAIINADARIEGHVIINSGAIIEHDCRIGQNTHVAPGSILGGGVTIGTDSLVGLGARVLPGVRIGAGCIIGSGAVVLQSVKAGDTVVGVPAQAPALRSTLQS